jgi:hypothetical protein
MMRRGFRVALTLLVACGASFAAPQTWMGRISAGLCGTAHMDSGCIRNCIKAGEKYVFVSKGKVREIQNQDFGDLEKHAGHTVKLTGTLGSNGKTVTVSKIEMGSAR